MKISKNKDGLFLRINTPEGIDFLEQHRDLIDSHGFVWIAKFGKTKLLLKGLKKENLLVLTDTDKNNKNSYIAFYDDVIYSDDGKNPTPYPEYYNDVVLGKSLWFKVNSIKPIDFNLINDSFVIKSSFNSVESIRKTSCQVCYIKSKYDLDI